MYKYMHVIEIILRHREAILIDKGPLAVQNIYMMWSKSARNVR